MSEMLVSKSSFRAPASSACTVEYDSTTIGDSVLNSNNNYEPKRNNQDLLDKMNQILEMFEDQKEIKTGQKNEEIVLYCFLGVFIIYIMDSFVNIGRYSR